VKGRGQSVESGDFRMVADSQSRSRKNHGGYQKQFGPTNRGKTSESRCSVRDEYIYTVERSVEKLRTGCLLDGVFA
jgi:hypothetical protein